MRNEMKVKILFTGPMIFLTFAILLFIGLSGCSESPMDNSSGT
jgi:hypothetical protein